MLLPASVKYQSACRVVVLLALRKQWMVGGGEVGMEVPVVALAARMTRWAVGGRHSHPFVSFSASQWVETAERSASTVRNRFATLVRTPVRPRGSFGAGLGGVGRLMSV